MPKKLRKRLGQQVPSARNTNARQQQQELLLTFWRFLLSHIISV